MLPGLFVASLSINLRASFAVSVANRTNASGAASSELRGVSPPRSSHLSRPAASVSAFSLLLVMGHVTMLGAPRWESVDARH